MKKIEVRYEEGRGLEKLIVWPRVVVKVGRGLDGQLVRRQVPAFYLAWIPF